MSEFPTNRELSRRERARIASVQAVIAHIAANTTIISISVEVERVEPLCAPQASDDFYNDSLDDFDRVFGNYDNLGQ